MANAKGESNLGLTIGGKLVPGKLTAYEDGTAKWTYQKDISGIGDQSTFTLTKKPDGTWTWSPTTNTSIENLASKENLTNTQITDSLYKTPQLQTTLYGQTVNLLGGIQSAKQIDPNYPTTQGVTTTPNIPIQQQVSGNSNRPQETISLSDLEISQIQADDSGKEKWWYKIGPLIYPTDISKNGQDYIEFNVFEYVTRGRNQTNPLLFGERTLPRDSKIRIRLPIQPSITDTNTVDWNSSSLNPVEMGLYSLADAGMTGAQGQLDHILSSMGNTITQDSNAGKALLLYLKQKAIGTTGLVSRFGGAVVNPNMELLFQGPQLRPFNFSFRLSPRDDGEAKIVKTIIRVFKEAMAVRTASNGIFLAAPHIFNISYKNGALNKEHTSLNKIKTCALQSCSVDYTPDGSYMTFDDTTNGNPMTSYNLTLQFQELEPVTDKDYATVSADQIGY